MRQMDFIMLFAKNPNQKSQLLSHFCKNAQYILILVYHSSKKVFLQRPLQKKQCLQLVFLPKICISVLTFQNHLLCSHNELLYCSFCYIFINLPH